MSYGSHDPDDFLAEYQVSHQSQPFQSCSPLLPENFHETRFPFGKFVGRTVSDVPFRYLDWALGMREEKGAGNFMRGEHDDFFMNLRLYMEQDWVKRELEKELEGQ